MRRELVAADQRVGTKLGTANTAAMKRRFNSPVDSAIAGAADNLLWSAVYRALDLAVDHHPNNKLKKHWRGIGAFATAKCLVDSVSAEWTDDCWGRVPEVFFVEPMCRRFIHGVEAEVIVGFVRFWQDGEPLRAEIDADPWVEYQKYCRLLELRRGLNR